MESKICCTAKAIVADLSCSCSDFAGSTGSAVDQHHLRKEVQEKPSAHSLAGHSCDEEAVCTGCAYVKPTGEHVYGEYVQKKAPMCQRRAKSPASASARCALKENSEELKRVDIGTTFCSKYWKFTRNVCLETLV